MRPTLGVAKQNIDLNYCALDELQRIQKLVADNQKELIRLRQNHPQGIRTWADMRKLKGIGPASMTQLFVYCKDPATTPLTAEAAVPDNDVSAGDRMDLPEILQKGQAPASSSDDLEMCGLGVILHTMDVTLGQQSTKWQEAFLAAGSEEKPGRVMLDSGCFRCIAGKRTHSKMKAHLKQYGFKPLEINNVEEGVFGN